MRLRSWLVVGISVVLLVAVGAVGVSVNRSALRAAETVHRSDSLALVRNNATLAGQLLMLSAKELNDFATTHRLNVTPGDAEDRQALQDYAAKSGFFSHGVVLTDLNGNALNATRAAAELPLPNDPGFEPMRASLKSGQPGISSVMNVGDFALHAVAVPVISGGFPAGILVGYVRAGQNQLQGYMEKLSTPDYTSMVLDSSGVIASASDPKLVNTVVNAAILPHITSTEPKFVNFTQGDQSMVALVTGGMPGGWAYARVQATAVFDGPVRNRSLTINVALLTMLLVGVGGLAVLGYRSQLVRRRAEERFAALVEHAPDVLTVLNSDGWVIYSSPSAQRILGVTSLGQSVFDILHPEDRPETERRFGALLAERDGLARMQVRVRQLDGNFRWFDFTASNKLDNPALNGIVINARDVTDSRETQDKLTHDAYHDPLTGLPNRRRLQERLASTLHSSSVGVLFVDLDGFKPVNDELGHEAGDELLRQVGDRLSRCLREGDVLARVGGDEFVLLVPGVSDDDPEARAIVERLRGVIAEPFEIGGHEVHIGASVGLHVAGPGEEPDDVLRTADRAMYAVKRGSSRPGRHRAT